MKAGFAKLMMVVAVVAVAGSTTAWAQDSCPASFTTPSYSPDFSNVSDQLCLTLNGNYDGASRTSYPPFVTNSRTVLRLTPNAGVWATSAWFNLALSFASIKVDRKSVSIA